MILLFRVVKEHRVKEGQRERMYVQIIISKYYYALMWLNCFI